MGKVLTNTTKLHGSYVILLSIFIHSRQGINNISWILDISMESQDQNTFELGDDEAYAGIAVKVWQAVRFFNELKAVAFNELPLGDQECPICRQEYDDPEKENVGCIPVRLPCSHVLGKECLAIWITPLGGWKDMNGQWEQRMNWFKNPFIRFSGAADCPLCRRVFFEKPRYWESAKGLEARLLLWDRAYKKAGYVCSEKEKQSRADLTQYIEFYRKAKGNTVEKTETEIDQRWRELEAYHAITRGFLLDFIIRHMHRILNPNQARLRRILDHISTLELGLGLDNPLFNFIKAQGNIQSMSFIVERRNREGNGTENSDGEGGNDVAEEPNGQVVNS